MDLLRADDMKSVYHLTLEIGFWMMTHMKISSSPNPCRPETDIPESCCPHSQTHLVIRTAW